MSAIILSPLVIFLVHAVICRLPLSKGIARIRIAALCSVVSALVITLVVTLFSPSLSPRWEVFLFSLLVTLALAHVYFHIFNMSETARRIKILLQIRAGQTPDDGKSYAARDLVMVRLERLEELDQVEVVDGRFRPQRTLLYYVAVLMKGYEKLIFPGRV